MTDEIPCPFGACDGSGFVIDEATRVARPCRCRPARLERRRARRLSAVIPRKYQGVSFDRPPVSDMARDMTTRHVVNAVRGFIDDLDGNLAAGKGLWLMGNTGTGKTTLGMLAAKVALAAGHTVAVYFAPKLLTQIRQTYQATESEDAYDAFFRRLTSVDLLYIDDLGSERHTDWVVEQLYALVNERYENQRSMLITSNASRDVEEGRRQLEEQIGSRTVSRLVEICGELLPLFGSDMRREFRVPAAPERA